MIRSLPIHRATRIRAWLHQPTLLALKDSARTLPGAMPAATQVAAACRDGRLLDRKYTHALLGEAGWKARPVKPGPLPGRSG